MQLNIVITEQELRKIVLEKLQEKLGDVKITESDVKIETKSKQNYRSEWETAAFRATVVKHDA